MKNFSYWLCLLFLVAKRLFKFSFIPLLVQHLRLLRQATHQDR